MIAALLRKFRKTPSQPRPVDPLIQAIHSRRAWLRFQNEVRRRREERRLLHKPTRDIDQAQRDRVHAALRAGRP